jgi:hypothetical protein
MNVVDKILEIETRKLMGYPGLETRPTVPAGTPTAGTEALKDPWVDPTAAFAGGAGGIVAGVTIPEFFDDDEGGSDLTSRLAGQGL